MMMNVLQFILQTQPASFAETLPAETYSPSLYTLETAGVFFKSIFVLLFICGLAYFILKYGLPKTPFAKRQNLSKIKMIDSFTLETRKKIYWFRVEDQNFLVGSSDASVTALGQWPVQEKSFDQILKEEAPKHDSKDKNS